MALGSRPAGAAFTNQKGNRQGRRPVEYNQMEEQKRGEWKEATGMMRSSLPFSAVVAARSKMALAGGSLRRHASRLVGWLISTTWF